MITGFNTDIEHGGVVYHVQTEDKGFDTPIILSLVYAGGQVEITRTDAIARGDSAFVDEQRGYARLMRGPQIEGRGDRQVQFIHLPQRCTIRIFTLRGELVRVHALLDPLLDQAAAQLLADAAPEARVGEVGEAEPGAVLREPRRQVERPAARAQPTCLESRLGHRLARHRRR